MAPSRKSAGRVLIMDDVAWSEVPRDQRGSSGAEDLTPASWVTQDDWRGDLVASDTAGASHFTGVRRPGARARREEAQAQVASTARGSSSARAGSSSAGRVQAPGRSSAAGRAILEGTGQPPTQAGGLRVLAEFDWTSADAHTIEDRIWGAGRRDHDDSTAAELTLATDADVAEDEALWGPRPRLMSDEPGGRRTVVITGRVADRYAAPRRGAEDSHPVHHRFTGIGNADRMALWAVGLGVMLVLVALLSSH